MCHRSSPSTSDPRGALSKKAGRNPGWWRACFVYDCWRIGYRLPRLHECGSSPDRFRNRISQRQLVVSHPVANLRPGPDRGDSGPDDPHQFGGYCLVASVARDHRHSESKRQRTARSLASDGKPRTSRWRSSPAKRTTWKWVSPTCSQRPGTRRRPATKGSKSRTILSGQIRQT